MGLSLSREALRLSTFPQGFEIQGSIPQTGLKDVVPASPPPVVWTEVSSFSPAHRRPQEGREGWAGSGALGLLFDHYRALCTLLLPRFCPFALVPHCPVILHSPIQICLLSTYCVFSTARDTAVSEKRGASRIKCIVQYGSSYFFLNLFLFLTPKAFCIGL